MTTFMKIVSFQTSTVIPFVQPSEKPSFAFRSKTEWTSSAVDVSGARQKTFARNAKTIRVAKSSGESEKGIVMNMERRVLGKGDP